MNIFTKLALDERSNDTKLGMPSTDVGHRQRRLDFMKAIRNGAGFRHEPKKPRKDTQGLTRGDRKRARRAAADARVNEDRAKEFRHSSGAYVELVTLKAAA